MSIAAQVPRPATSRDVAARAGVSRATVSHILNGQHDRFPDETRRKVLAAAAELEYVPSPAGRTLANGRSDTLVLLFPNTSLGGNLQDTVDLVAAATAQVGANVLVRFVGDDAALTVSSLLRLQPMAVVDLSGTLTTQDRARFASTRTVVVPEVTEQRTSELLGILDQIAELQVRALTAGGARRIVFAYLLDSRRDVYGPLRHESVNRAARRFGIETPETISVPLEIEGAIHALTEARRLDEPIGIACFNDDVAVALAAAAIESGLRVPEDVSVVGVDRTAMGQLFRPRLTTIAVSNRAVADQAINDLLDALGVTHPEPLSLTGSQQVELINGETT